MNSQNNVLNGRYLLRVDSHQELTVDTFRNLYGLVVLMKLKDRKLVFRKDDQLLRC